MAMSLLVIDIDVLCSKCSICRYRRSCCRSQAVLGCMHHSVGAEEMFQCLPYDLGIAQTWNQFNRIQMILC